MQLSLDMASHILSGCPSVTDSDVNNLFSIVNSPLYQYFIFVNNIKYLYYYYYIFSKGGFTDGLLKAQECGEVQLITLEDLYK